MQAIHDLPRQEVRKPRRHSFGSVAPLLDTCLTVARAARRSRSLELWGCRWAAGPELAAVQRDQALELGRRVHVFGEEIRRVLLAIHLPELELLAPESLLDPKAMALEMAQLAKGLPGYSSESGRTVGPDSDR